jgi:hypothetical protein
MSKMIIQAEAETLKSLIKIATTVDPYGIFLNKQDLTDIIKQINEQSSAGDNK